MAKSTLISTTLQTWNIKSLLTFTYGKICAHLFGWLSGHCNLSFLIFDEVAGKRGNFQWACMIVQSHLKTITRAIMRVLNGDNSTEEAAFFNLKQDWKNYSMT